MKERERQRPSVNVLKSVGTFFVFVAATFCQFIAIVVVVVVLVVVIFIEGKTTFKGILSYSVVMFAFFFFFQIWL